MFYRTFVCLFVFFPSISNFTQNYSSVIHENFTRDVSLDKEVNIKM